MIEGNIAIGERIVTNWPILVNLKADPYEEMWHESDMYIRWYGDNMWLFVPSPGRSSKKFFVTIPQFPFQEGVGPERG